MRCRASDDVGTGISLQSALVTAAPWLVVCPLVARAFATAALDVPLLRARIAVLPAAIRAGVNVHPVGMRYDARAGGDRDDAALVRRRRCRA